MRGGYWPFIGVVLLILGLILHQVPLILVASLLLLVRGVTRLWDRYGLARVDFRRKLSTDRAFFGEEIYLEMEVDNRKLLPLPWLEVDDEMPEAITFLRGTTTASHKVARVHLTNLLSMGWYHRVRRRYPIRCDMRGSFSFGPTRIRAGDLFGFSQQETEFYQTDRLTVYPRVVPLEQPRIPSKQPLGDIRTRRFIFQDPVLTLGVRDYTYGDSLKRIHWKTTARTGRLQTKVYEPTTSVDMGIMLDVRTVPAPGWGGVTQLQELGIMTAAAIANHAMSAGFRVGLYVNQRRQYTGEPVRLPPSQHSEQMVRILEALAQIHHSVESLPIARFVSLESRLLPWGSTLVVITAAVSDGLLATLTGMKRAGRGVTLVVIGGSRGGASLNGLSVFRVPDDISWREVETITLQRAAS